MKPDELEKHTDEIVASISFAWTLFKPEMLQTFHALALQATPATAGMVSRPSRHTGNEYRLWHVAASFRNAAVLRLVGHSDRACGASVHCRGRPERPLWLCPGNRETTAFAAIFEHHLIIMVSVLHLIVMSCLALRQTWAIFRFIGIMEPAMGRPLRTDRG